MNFLDACALNPLLLIAIQAGIIASIIGGTVGTLVVVRRITFVSGSISHSVLGGMGLFLWLERTQGWSLCTPLMGAITAGVISACLISFAQHHLGEREDSFIATLWAFGMATGIVFMSKTPGYSVELTNLLIGNILWVTREDLYLLLLLAAASLIFISFSFQKLKLMLFDEEQAILQGINTKRLSLCLLLLVSITVVALIQVVGTVLVMTMLTLPQMIAAIFSKRLSYMMIASSIISCGLTLLGLVLSFYLDWPAGASIAIISTIAYVSAQTVYFFMKRALS